MPANCATAVNKCYGCSTCSFGYQRSNNQCMPCLGGQASDVCKTYKSPGSASCECTACSNGWRPVNGACEKVRSAWAASVDATMAASLVARQLVVGERRASEYRTSEAWRLTQSRCMWACSCSPLLQCTDDNCRSYQSNLCFCTTCKANYTASGGRCVAVGDASAGRCVAY